MKAAETCILFKEKFSTIRSAFRDSSLTIRAEEIPVKVKEILHYVPVLLISKQKYQIAFFFKSKYQIVNITLCKKARASSFIFKWATSYPTKVVIFGDDVEKEEIKLAKTFGISVINHLDGKLFYYK